MMENYILTLKKHVKAARTLAGVGTSCTQLQSKSARLGGNNGHRSLPSLAEERKEEDGGGASTPDVPGAVCLPPQAHQA